VLVEDTYNTSIHGQLLAKGDDRGPTCIQCHSSHQIAPPERPEFRLGIDEKCGRCHEDRLERYRETLHGKAIALGRANVAACSDCHGHHDILKGENPDSRIHDQNRLQTCRNCHPEATRNFANYIVHSDHTDKKTSPQVYWVYIFMTALLIGTFGFFAVNSILWAIRSAVTFFRDRKQFREIKIKSQTDEEVYVRFKPIERFLHILVILSFMLLVVTGMPLKFYYTDWAQWIFWLMNGQAVAAVLHRVGAFITIFYFVTHILTLSYAVWSGRSRFRDTGSGRYTLRKITSEVFGPDSPVPTFQDIRDWWAHQKWFFGKGEQPQFDRWTYWEKFDYMAVFWGVAVIGVSGLVMWFPEAFTTFLPGWAINVALVIHSDEALLATGFIFTFHFFNVHFRLEKFPIDTVIFSGRVSRTELYHERRRQLERWEKEGKLEENRVKDEWKSWKNIAIPAGIVAFLLGIAIVALVYSAMITRLLHD
jgi:thiosulfate reductase cytochrome b subunit